jgi:hypothetical protein
MTVGAGSFVSRSLQLIHCSDLAGLFGRAPVRWSAALLLPHRHYLRKYRHSITCAAGKRVKQEFLFQGLFIALPGNNPRAARQKIPG